jgi:acetolactate synthase-1/2/3 large subunit
MQRHGGQILADQLKLRGVRRVFSVPGESFLAALDGLYESGIENIVCRQEGGAAMMAEAFGKMTGTPGVLFVTRGPGATNASAGLHIARQDSTPMVVFIGQIARAHRDRDAFQEVDYRAFFGPLVKWVAEVDDTARLPEYIDRAFRVAQSGRPGPVVLSLPEDMLSALADVPDRPARPAPMVPDLSHFAAAAMEHISKAERPLVIVGGPHWSPEAEASLAAFAATTGLPVAVPFRRQDLLDNANPAYVGDLGVGMNPALGAALKEADCVLAIGTRLGDTLTDGYTLLDPHDHGKLLLHVHADTAELGRVYAPDLCAVATAPDALAALNKIAAPCQATWRSRLRTHYDAWQIPRETPGDLKLENIISWLSDTLPVDAIVTNGAGNYAAFLHRYFRYKGFGTQLAPTSGSMGYGFPAAISAAIEYPARTVVCLAGDGCFQMTLNEMSTAAQYGAKPVVIVVNNGRYGTIRMHQEKTYPGRVSGTELFNPDFAALVQAYGGHGERVSRTQDFAAAFARATASGKMSVIELDVDPEALSTGMTLSQTRAAGQKAQSGNTQT